MFVQELRKIQCNISKLIKNTVFAQKEISRNQLNVKTFAKIRERFYGKQ